MSEQLGSGKFAGKDELPVATVVRLGTCVLDDRRPGRRALVTGASSGIGKAYTEKLAVEGWDVTVAARDTARLAALKSALEAAHGVNIKILTADLAKREDQIRLAAEIAGEDSLLLLINNAGVSMVGNLVTLDEQKLYEMLMVNSVAPTMLARAALPGMIERGRGAIINVASAGAFVAAPTSGAYCGSKALINSLTEGLSGELDGTGVQVQALCPGMTMTEMHIRGDFDVSWVPSWMTAEQVVEASFEGLRLGEVVCVPGLQDAALTAEMRAVGNSIVGQTIQSVVAPRYKSASAV